MDVHGPVAVRHSTVPDALVNVFAIDHSVRALCEGSEHFELADGEACPDSADERLAVVKSDLERPEQEQVARLDAFSFSLRSH